MIVTLSRDNIIYTRFWKYDVSIDDKSYQLKAGESIDIEVASDIEVHVSVSGNMRRSKHQIVFEKNTASIKISRAVSPYLEILYFVILTLGFVLSRIYGSDTLQSYYLVAIGFSGLITSFYKKNSYFKVTLA